jgi:AraC-like DNA-binding protein
MQTIITTAGMPPRDAFEYWHDVACAKLIKHESDPLNRTNFYAEMKAGALADLTLLAYKTAGATGRSSRGDGLLLILPFTRVALVFGERQFEANGSSLVLLDAQEQHFSRNLEPVVQIGLRIPRTALAQRIPIGKEATNRPIQLRDDAALLKNFLRSLTHTGPSTLSPAARIMACEHALDLTAMMLGNLAGVTPELSSPERIVMIKLRMAIEGRLTDLTADRASIAAAAGISERHANRLLAQEGTSITELLRKRRLAKCREALEQSKRRIGDIARDFGWIDAANFNRDFKREFGLTPRAARYLLIHINKK